MKANNLLKSLQRAGKKVVFKAKKNSPELLIIAGVAGTVVSAVLACKATTRLEEATAEHREQIEAFKRAHEEPETLGITHEDYTDKDYSHDLTIGYVKLAVDVTKLYAPSVVLGVASIAAIFASHNMMRKRNLALAAAYAAVESGFKDYRKNVIDRFGEAMDKELKYNLKAKEITETVVDEKTGKTKTEKKTIMVGETIPNSPYAKFFDEASRYWEKDSEYNKEFLLKVQAQMNDKLAAQGYLFLNEVYDALDIPRTKAGQIVGWVYESSDEYADGKIDFGIFDLNRETNNKDFVNGYERVILLDFNVDGNILDLM